MSGAADRRLLSYLEAADQLGITLRTLRNWVSAKRIEYVKIGRLTKFRQREIDRYIDDNTVRRENP